MAWRFHEYGLGIANATPGLVWEEGFVSRVRRGSFSIPSSAGPASVAALYQPSLVGKEVRTGHFKGNQGTGIWRWRPRNTRASILDLEQSWSSVKSHLYGHHGRPSRGLILTVGVALASTRRGQVAKLYATLLDPRL